MQNMWGKDFCLSHITVYSCDPYILLTYRNAWPWLNSKVSLCLGWGRRQQHLILHQGPSCCRWLVWLWARLLSPLEVLPIQIFALSWTRSSFHKQGSFWERKRVQNLLHCTALWSGFMPGTKGRWGLIATPLIGNFRHIWSLYSAHCKTDWVTHILCSYVKTPLLH